MPAGVLDQISIGVESAVNTAVTPTVSISVLPCDGINIEQEPGVAEGINTQPGLVKAFVPGSREYPGTYEMNAHFQDIGYFLKSGLGACSSAAKAGESTVYTHSFTESVVKPSLTVEEVKGLSVRRYAGFIVSRFSLDIAEKEAVKFKVEGKAMSDATATAITAVYEPNNDVFHWNHVKSITLGGTDIKSLLSKISIEYSNGLASFHGLAAQNPTQLFTANSEVGGSIEAYLDSTMLTYLDIFKATTEQALIITLEDTTVIGSTSYNSLAITVPKVALSTFAVPVDTGFVKVTSDIKGGVADTDGLISAVLTNTLASY